MREKRQGTRRGGGGKGMKKKIVVGVKATDNM